MRHRTRRPGEASPAGIAPIVGRDSELAILTHVLEDARSSRGRIVAIVGEAGMGKTRRRRDSEAAEGSLHILANLGPLGRIAELKEELPRAEALAERARDVRLVTVVSGIRASVAILEASKRTHRWVLFRRWPRRNASTRRSCNDRADPGTIAAASASSGRA